MDAFVDPERQAFEAFKDLPRGTPIHMLNLVRFRAVARYPTDHPLAEAGIGGREAYRRYGLESGPVFARVGGQVIWSGRPEVVLIGPSDECWHTAFVAAYPSASAFLEMITDGEYRLAVVHRQAAVLTSRLIRMSPTEPGSGFA